jgi:glycosyltransferase involved in cell wall biosynthesis
MADAPVVSICVPTIGRVEYLPEVEASLSAQTFRDFEVLVLDNESPAEAEWQIRGWAERDPRVRVLRVSPRVPMFENFRRGIVATRGKYVTFCHDDDAVFPTFLERNVAFMESHPEAAFAGSNYVFMDGSGKIFEERAWIRRTETWDGRRYIRALMRRGRNPITMQSVFYRREPIVEHFDATISPHYGDFVILMRMAEHGRVGFIAETLVKVRQHDGQASKWPVSRGIPLRTQILLDYCRELRSRWPADEVAALERDVRRAHALYLAWGWLAAPDREEADACIASMNGSKLESGLAAVLRGVDRIGATPAARRRIADFARRVANR